MTIKKEQILKYGIPAVVITTGATFLLQGNGKKVLKGALRYNGQKEIHPNKGWQNKYFESLMKSIGWKQGYDYCVLFTKLVLLNTLKGKKREIVKKLFNASSPTTWLNLLRNQHLGLYKISKKPSIGSIAFYKHMKKDWRGHADIVKDYNKEKFSVISANGSIGVEIKNRSYSFESNDFRLLGFVKF